MGSSVALRRYNTQLMYSSWRKSKHVLFPRKLSVLEGNVSTGDLNWFPRWQEQLCSHPNVHKERALSKRKEDHLGISQAPISMLVH